MKTIYIVISIGGRWEDAWEHGFVAVKTEERAKELVEVYQKKSDKHHEDMMWHKDHPEDMPEHDYGGGVVDSGIYEVEHLCSEHCKACEIEEYFPSDDEVMYRYEEVELED